MPETVSLSGLGIAGLAAVYVLARPASAVSGEANVVQQAASQALYRVERSQALFGAKAKCISDLIALAEECSQNGWDGSDASALDPSAVDRAIEFIRALPDSVPLPELAPEPDGAISMDWIKTPRRLFSVSVSASSRFAYAWLDGSDVGHGVARFDGYSVPDRIAEGIASILNQDDAALGTR